MDCFGTLTIKFSQEILEIGADLFNDTNLNVSLTPAEDIEEDSYLNKSFVWYYQSFSEDMKELSLRINFTDPLSISQGIK